MKINIKKQILEMIQTLYEGIDYIRIASYSEGKQMLVQFEEFITIIKDTVSKEESEDSILTTLFIQCRELIIELEQQYKNAEHKEKFILLIMSKLEEIYDFIINHVPTEKYQAVFLPYKASMWDSFDSIYRVIQEDEEWEAIVMPIPYFNINRDGKVFSEEYEGNQLPADIIVTDYKGYDLAKKRPEVIFIHNPYDDTNIVTQVPEEYYSTRLKKYTNRLVYIPYFVTGGKVDLHFTILPGVQNAWRTFVENEETRQSYIRYNLPEKIVALGSPKNDMVKGNTSNIEIPQEWKQKLKGKNVFMLNTHIRSIMAYSEAFITKLRYIIEQFKDRQDIALLWRPHPLSLETIKSMNSQIYQHYLELIKEVRGLENGVYDDTSDLHRAIALSDAYIGDGYSSVVALYKQTEKPMFIFNLNNYITQAEEERILYFSAATIDNNQLWFSAINFNGLFKIDLETKNIEYSASFCKESAMQLNLHKEVVEQGENLYFIPSSGQYVAIFNKKSGKMNYIEIKKGPYAYNKFSGAYILENELWLFPNTYNAIVKINLESDTTEYYDDWFDEMQRYTDTVNGTQFINKEIVEETVWLSSLNANILLSFNLRTKAYEIHRVGDYESKYKNIVYDGNQFWLVNTGKKCITLWNPQENKVHDVNITDALEDGALSLDIFYAKGHIWGIINDKQKIFKVNKAHYNIQWLESHKEDFMAIKSRQHENNTITVCEKDDFIYLIPMSGSGIYKIDVSTNEIEIIDTKINQMMFEEIWDKITKDGHQVLHERAYTLPRILDYIDVLSNKSKSVGSQYNEYHNALEESAGYKIWKYIISDI